MAIKVAKAAKSGTSQPTIKPKEVQPAPNPPTCPPAYVDEIRRRAYLRWQAAGNQPGDGVKFWLDAEAELFLGK